MYGLGEVLPAGPLYSGQDSAAAGIVAQYPVLAQGGAVGGNYDEFQEAVSLGWVPNTQEGYDRFLYYMTNGALSAATLNAVPEFMGWSTAWQWAESLSHGATNWTPDYAPTLWSAELRGWISSGMTEAAANIADAAFRRYFPQYLARFGVSSVPTIPVVDWTGAITNQVTGVLTPLADITYAGPFPNRPGTVLFQVRTGETWTWAGDWSGPVIGTPHPPQSLLDALANADAATVPPVTLLTRTFDAIAIHPTLDPARYFAVSDPTLYAVKYQRVHESYSDGTSSVTPWFYLGAGSVWLPLSALETAAAWGSDGFGPLWPDRVHLRTWESLSASEQATVLAESATGPATPTPVPPIPGSHIYVPAPGTGQEPTILLPGATTPIPVSQLPPSIANQNTTPPVPASTGVTLASIGDTLKNPMLLIGLLIGAVVLGSNRGGNQ